MVLLVFSDFDIFPLDSLMTQYEGTMNISYFILLPTDFTVLTFHILDLELLMLVTAFDKLCCCGFLKLLWLF